MRKNKKGVTLVELIICCGIIVMIGGACTAVLMSGHKIFTNSSNSANAQLDTNVIQTYFTNVLPRSKSIFATSIIAAQENTEDFCIYFAGDDKVFTLRTAGKDVALNSVADFKYNLIPAGDGTDDAVKPQFIYTVTMKDGSSYTGGYVLMNLHYKKCDEGLRLAEGLVDAKTTPVRFSTTSAAASS